MALTPPVLLRAAFFYPLFAARAFATRRMTELPILSQ